MSPLQKVAMGLLIVFWTAPFAIGGYAWDGLPDPLGWALVLAGAHALHRHVAIQPALWAGWVALLASIPQWVPPLFEALLPDEDVVAEASIRWAFFLPQAIFCVLLVRAIGQAAIEQQPRDSYVAGRFGVLTWATGAIVVLPPVAYGVDDQALIDAALVGIVLVGLVLCFYLFRVHRRTWLGGPGPLEVASATRRDDR